MQEVVRTTEKIVSCSDDGQHPLVYISLESGRGRCPYCSREFVRVPSPDDERACEAA